MMRALVSYSKTASRQDLQRLSEALNGLATLGEVLTWALRQNPDYPIVDVVVQDEFSHDAVLAWHSGLHLVFETS